MAAVLSESVLDQNGPNDYFGQNDLIPNRLLAFARPKWSILVHFGLKRSILVHLGPPTVLWPFLTKESLAASDFWGYRSRAISRPHRPRDTETWTWISVWTSTGQPKDFLFGLRFCRPAKGPRSGKPPKVLSQECSQKSVCCQESSKECSRVGCQKPRPLKFP